MLYPTELRGHSTVLRSARLPGNGRPLGAIPIWRARVQRGESRDNREATRGANSDGGRDSDAVVTRARSASVFCSRSIARTICAIRGYSVAASSSPFGPFGMMERPVVNRMPGLNSGAHHPCCRRNAPSDRRRNRATLVAHPPCDSKRRSVVPERSQARCSARQKGTSMSGRQKRLLRPMPLYLRGQCTSRRALRLGWPWTKR